MVKAIAFTKMSGTGNDFIMIDNRKKVIKQNLNRLAKQLCFRQRGIGADGVILLESSKKHDFRMRIFNADGTEAEMCGNGARCVAEFARHHHVTKKKNINFDTMSGLIQAVFTKRGVKISLGIPKKYKNRFSLKGVKGSFYFVNTGVPHAVGFVTSNKKTDVINTGRKIRRHSHFAPSGTNVNFVQILKKNEIHVRTYERGVEDETLACGTGACASAVVGIILGKLKSPVKVRTTGGDILYVHYSYQGRLNIPVYLEGKVVTTFQGQVALNHTS
ncbi:diaminopimelate epimerase [PVC group bacterium]|nr:diaminopimelate epimerase [PVC group bacterium]